MLIYIYSKNTAKQRLKNLAARTNMVPSYKTLFFWGLILMLTATVIFFFGIYTNNMRERCTESTTGVVKSVKKLRVTKKTGTHRTETNYWYKTTYEFKVDGKVYSGRSTLDEKRRLYEGSSLSVNYNPSKPGKEHYTPLDADCTGKFAVSVFFGVIGIIILAAGIKDKARFNRSNGINADLNGMNNTDKC